MSNETVNPPNIQYIANEGMKIYERIKERYEPDKNGKFLAIEVESEDAYLGATGVEAITEAKSHHPDKMFYLAKVGFETTEMIAEYYLNRYWK